MGPDARASVGQAGTLAAGAVTGRPVLAVVPVTPVSPVSPVVPVVPVVTAVVIAILAGEKSFGVIKVFVDEYGEVRHDGRAQLRSAAPHRIPESGGAPHCEISRSS